MKKKYKKKKTLKTLLIECKDTGELCSSYHDYFNSKHFLDLKKAYLSRYDLKQVCVICGHWKVDYKVTKSATYGSERVEDLYPLCREHWGFTDNDEHNSKLRKTIKRKAEWLESKLIQL